MRIFALEILGENSQGGAIYNPPKICPLATRKGQKCPSGRPPGRPANGHFYDRCTSGRPPGRPTKAIGRSPGDRPPPVSGVLSVGRPRGRLAEFAGHVHVLVHIGRPTTSPVDR